MAFYDPPQESHDWSFVGIILLVVGLVVAAVPTLNLGIDRILFPLQ